MQLLFGFVLVDTSQCSCWLSFGVLSYGVDLVAVAENNFVRPLQIAYVVRQIFGEFSYQLFPAKLTDHTFQLLSTKISKFDINVHCSNSCVAKLYFYQEQFMFRVL